MPNASGARLLGDSSMDVRVEQTEAMRALHVVWSGERRTFLVVAADSLSTELSHGLQPELRDEDLPPFKIESSGSDVLITFAQMQTRRTVVLERILSSRMPLRPLQQFLGQWQAWLASVDRNSTAQLASIDLVEMCEELVALARGWVLLGGIVQARSVLRGVFDALRRRLKAPCAVVAPQNESEEDQVLRAVAVTAKELLLECVAFQTSLARCKLLAERHGAPPALASELSKQLWTLLRQAPFSLEITTLLANLMMQQQQHTPLLRLLEGPTPRFHDPRLTLMYARALGYSGFYRQSLEATEVFLSTKHDQALDRTTDDQLLASEALKRYHRRLAALLIRRDEVEELQRTERYDEAIRCFDECLLLVDAADRNGTAALLFGRANALLETQALSAAMRDLKRSLQLDPSNRMASLRMRTVQLQLQTKRLKDQLSKSKPITPSGTLQWNQRPDKSSETVQSDLN